MKLFVYGTLQQGWGNNRLLNGATFLGKALTKKPYVLFNGGFPYAVPVSPDESMFPLLPVMGEVYEVEQRHVDVCDYLEGHPSWYQRTNIRAFINPGVEYEDQPSVEVMIYEMPRLDRYQHYHLCNTKDNMYYWSG